MAIVGNVAIHQLHVKAQNHGSVIHFYQMINPMLQQSDQYAPQKMEQPCHHLQYNYSRFHSNSSLNNSRQSYAQAFQNPTVSSTVQADATQDFHNDVVLANY